ncbi:hypothetical protein FLGE108171_10760 [Flavobacterium gelidilacus]
MKNMKNIITLLAIGSVLFSCTDDDIRIDHQLNSGDKIVGFAKSLETVSYFADEGQVLVSFPINLIGTNGEPLSTDVDVEYAIDFDSSDATEGVEFNFASTVNTLTIPAGGTFVNFPLLVNTGQLNPIAKSELVLKLVSANNNTVVGQQFSTLKIVFVGCQSQIQLGNYSWVSTAGFSAPSTPITSTSVNNFEVAFPGVSAGGSPIPMQFNDICGDITVLGWDFSSSYLCKASDASYNSTTNQIVFNQLQVFNTTEESSGIFFDRKTTTYTKL